MAENPHYSELSQLLSELDVEHLVVGCLSNPEVRGPLSHEPPNLTRLALSQRPT